LYCRYNRCSGTLASQATVGHARALSGTPMYSRFGIQADEIHSAAAEYNKFRASMQVRVPVRSTPARRLRSFGCRSAPAPLPAPLLAFHPKFAAAVGRSPEDQRSRNGARARDGCAQEAGRSLTSLPSAQIPNPHLMPAPSSRNAASGRSRPRRTPLPTGAACGAIGS
jgi:hypothetical protein